MKIPPHSKLVLIGDSITDCGRVRPVAEGMDGELGNGYVSLVQAIINATYPSQQLRLINMGIGGNTVRDLAARWPTDVLALRPDWLSIMIGINDVWRNFAPPEMQVDHVPLAEFQQTLEQLIRQTRPRLQGLILMTPFFIEPHRADPMRAMMDEYGAVVRQLAERYDALFVDTQAAFDAAMTHIEPLSLAADRVHPNLTGHMILARAFLEAVGQTWSRT
ncbi:MAG: SGNH/GDSL hydrolase family protein [Chloroflexi bacterium]|nr:SGNH/GDSL hydrolase family protein [Chloroflexota bacterium]MBP8054987.1 SGNH/GDSL hydrolase family protein [Chloroflexota bacterium]